MIKFKQYDSVTKIVIPNEVQLSSTNFDNAFASMLNVKEISIPSSVTIISNTYSGCSNLTGSPVCGNNVVNMHKAYYCCNNLTGSPVCGEKVNDVAHTYWNCVNLHGNSYFYSPNIDRAIGCFYGRNTLNILNIYIPTNSTSLTTLLNNNTFSIVGTEITWTDDTATNGCYYNTQYNIYIYPVEDVATARMANGDD